MTTLWQDLKFGLRMLAKNPRFGVLITGILSLGIGITTVMFSLFDAAFLRNLPVRNPEDLVRMVRHLPKIGTYSEFPYPYYQALHDHSTTLTAAFGESKYFHFDMTDPAPAEEITIHGVTPEYFEALGVRALYGRVLLASDAQEAPGLPPAVLSFGFWQRRFGGDPRVVNGRTMFVNGRRFTIVGVMARDFNGLSIDTTPDVRIPMRAFLPLANISLSSVNLELAGRLKPGTTVAQAEAECRALWTGTMREYLRDERKFGAEAIALELRRGMGVEPLAKGVSVVRDRYGDVLKLLMASVGLLTLLVCANIGGILLARAATRQQEMAVRLAVGASRFRLIRQVAAENILISVLGAAGGWLIAMASLPLAVRMLPPIRDVSTMLVPVSVEARLNGRVFVFLLAISVMTMLLFSISPALAVARSNLDSLMRAARSSVVWRGRQALITLQIALCTFLLAVASLFVRTFQQLNHTDSGFDRAHVATFTVNLTGAPAATPAYLKLLTEHVRALPGVVSVATATVGVMRDHGVSGTVAPTGQKITPGDFLNSDLNYVSPDYFATMGMHILAGRDFTPGDAPKSKPSEPQVAMVNQAFVEHFFAQSHALGQRFGFAPSMMGIADGRYEIVGVVSDAKYRSLRQPVKPTFYTLATESDEFVLYVRTRTKPEGILNQVRKVSSSIDPNVPFLEVHTLAEEIQNNTAGERETAVLASVFAAFAAVLAGAGIYGLLTYVVTERRREIGIRMALGARRAQVGGIVARQTLIMAAVGAALGLTGAVVSGSGIRSLLYGISPADPASLVAAGVLVALIACLATLPPALRATKVDPMVALRYE